MQTTDDQPILLLHLGFEGGSIRVYGQHSDGGGTVWKETNEMDFDDSDEEIWRETQTPLADFRSFWQDYTARQYWYMASPQEVHPSVRDQVATSIEQLRTYVRNSDFDYFQHSRLPDWEEALA